MIHLASVVNASLAVSYAAKIRRERTTDAHPVEASMLKVLEDLSRGHLSVDDFVGTYCSLNTHCSL